MTYLRSIGLRLLIAVGLSLTLWVYVALNENPDVSTSFQELPIRIEGKEQSLVLVDERGRPLPHDTLPTKLDLLVVRADSTTLGSLRRSDIEAYIDLSGLQAGTSTQPVRVRSLRPDLRLSFEERDPDFIPIQLEREITVTVPLSVAVEGEVPFVYERGAARLVGDDAGRRAAQIVGPEGLVRQVQLVQATVDIEGLTASFQAALPLEPVDSTGAPLEGVQVSPSAVNVNVPIEPSVGIKPVAVTAPPLMGVPASGYQVIGITVTPPFVNLTGSSESLAGVDSLDTQPITISGFSETIEREVGLIVPDGVSLVADAPRRVRVRVEIGPLDRPLTFSSPLPVQVVNIARGLVLRGINPTTLLLTLETTTALAGDLDISASRALVDAAGLGPGTYRLDAVLSLPDGVRLVGSVPEVTVTLTTPTATPAPPTERPTATVPPSATPTTAPTPTIPVTVEPASATLEPASATPEAVVPSSTPMLPESATSEPPSLTPNDVPTASLVPTEAPTTIPSEPSSTVATPTNQATVRNRQ